MVTFKDLTGKSKKLDDGTRLFLSYYDKYFNDLLEKAISMYEWKNLPDEIDYRFIEYTLMTQGKGVFFYDDSLKEFLFTKVVYNGKKDVYNNMKDRRGYAINGLNVKLNEKNSVLCFNTFLRRGIIHDIDLYATELANIKSTMDVNREQQKTPLLIGVSNDEKLTMRNMLQKIKGFAHHLMVSKHAFKNFSPTIINTESPYLLDKLQLDLEKRYEEALTFLGIETGNDKRERLLVGEVMASQGDVESQRYIYLNARRQCAEQLNNLYGLDVQVDFRSNITTVNTTVTKEYEKAIREKSETFVTGGELIE